MSATTEAIKSTVKTASKYWNNVFFPNMKLVVTRNSHETFPQTRKLMFKTECNVGKIDVRNYMKAVYDVEVPKLNTINVQGRIKRGATKNAYKQKDYKKVIITVDPKYVEPLKRK
ncbi:hypothetical protein SAMD00019534_082260 [Acytostelium subglobosum LB1]|uniref:hypothetical protein n=1 Tax=Acytostelium subglobosum LB1 TaxID=1410327 RepID=UPI0006447E62|nr:hypothetical protein SAMD00019534_082260 [Acytostelium subglobosum LB1]GAM25051.1 hypothetical protein SAMD00019534_082260 [Acytostelium subglobosum LB1]|eukprot:XP_012752140.1 hypothetical protein SAMD00019534_082260 [Acytostelium subglobosum LB1]